VIPKARQSRLGACFGGEQCQKLKGQCLLELRGVEIDCLSARCFIPLEPTSTGMSSAESLTLEETNKLRISLGLAPLGDGSSSSDAPVAQTEEDVAVENYRQVKEAADAEKAAKELKGRLDKARNQKELRAKLSGKGLGDAAATPDDEGTRAWVKKTKKNAATIQAELARKRLQEQEELDRELQAKYDESSLSGLKVAHDLDSFKEGERETILTLKDTRILDGEDDELVNVNMAEQERLEERLDLKKKGKQAGKYTGYDDEEFQSGSRNGVLSKYDVDIKEARADGSVGFKLGDVVRQADDEASGFEAVARPASKDKQAVAKELQKTLADLNYTSTLFSQSCYVFC
jgi:U4/U6.U5 tri-snRNP-associated protein 1